MTHIITTNGLAYQCPPTVYVSPSVSLSDQLIAEITRTNTTQETGFIERAAWPWLLFCFFLPVHLASERPWLLMNYRNNTESRKNSRQ